MKNKNFKILQYFKVKCYTNRHLRAGLTLIEIIITLAIFSIIVIAVTMVMTSTSKGFTSFEATNQLKKTNQETLNRIFIRLTECKRIFPYISTEPSPNFNSYLSRISATGTPPGCPVMLSGSKLPIIEESLSMAEGTTNFINASVGNRLFFANSDASKILENVKDFTGTSHTLRIDLYRFYYYYLTSENLKSILIKPSYLLIEWQSIYYADFNQINNITDSVLKKNTIEALYTNGINYAWNTSILETSINNAFYNLNSDGNIPLNSNHQIIKNQDKILTHMFTGTMGGGFRYGISCNTVDAANNVIWSGISKKIPQYAIASGNFPGGFEVIVVGSTSGRKVLIRSVLVAEGTMPGLIADDQVVLCSTRDLW